ncbi:unnamed protein product [Bursaphelenchus xylophilus]|uniref:(pine wood nematode) hypothetical protein n=1 Tax=Bursaphelenchus xylophilus TaxID=6326 RepID=A0A1I7S1M6_BURXY|nr:unnamed protein product [Bursaphelenchus xylophilus]CAG9081251.1 unnamed protein product [Bursaphelenchus xylophilus]
MTVNEMHKKYEVFACPSFHKFLSTETTGRPWSTNQMYVILYTNELVSIGTTTVDRYGRTPKSSNSVTGTLHLGTLILVTEYYVSKTILDQHILFKGVREVSRGHGVPHSESVATRFTIIGRQVTRDVRGIMEDMDVVRALCESDGEMGRFARQDLSMGRGVSRRNFGTEV